MFTDGISLFSGAGGDTIGLTKSGIHVIGYSEYIETFIETHDIKPVVGHIFVHWNLFTPQLPFQLKKDKSLWEVAV